MAIRRRQTVRSKRCGVEHLERRLTPAAVTIPALVPKIEVSHFGQDIAWVGSTGIHDISITQAGSGYTSAPAVTITGAGTGATAHAVLDGTDGSVLGVVLDAPGSGYDATTTVVTINGGGGSGAAATAQVYVTGKDKFRAWADDYIQFVANNKVRCAYVNIGDYSIDKDHYYDYLDPTAEGAGGVPWIVTEFLDRLPQGTDAGVIPYLDAADPWTLYDPNNFAGNVTTTDGLHGSPAKNNLYQAFELVNAINYAQLVNGGTKYVTHFQADGEGAGAFEQDTYYGFGPVGSGAYDPSKNRSTPNPAWTTAAEWPVAGYGYAKWLWNHFMPGTASAPQDGVAANLTGPGVPDVVFTDAEAVDPSTWSSGTASPYRFGIIKYAQTAWQQYSPGPMVAYTENYWFGENHYLPGPGSAIVPDTTIIVGGTSLPAITPQGTAASATYATPPVITFRQPCDAAGHPVGTAATGLAVMGAGAIDTAAIMSGGWVHAYFGGNGIGAGYSTGTHVVSGGTGYSRYDTVEFMPRGGDKPVRPASGVIVVDQNGSIIGVSVTDPGAGYTTEPEISITSAHGSGGMVKALILAADGYPQATVAAPPAGGRAASAFLQVADESTKSPGAILGITFVDPGAGYPRSPGTSFVDNRGIAVTISAPAAGGTPVGPIYAPVNSGAGNVASIVVTCLGDHYDATVNPPSYTVGTDPTVYTLSGGPSGNGIDPRYNGAYVPLIDLAGSFFETAGGRSAVSVVVPGTGFSAGALITTPGKGYDSTKEYTFQLPPPSSGGRAATARLVIVDGQAAGVEIIDAGEGYGGSGDNGVPFQFAPTDGATPCAGTMAMGNFPVVAVASGSEVWMGGTGTSAKPYAVLVPTSASPDPASGYSIRAIGMVNRGMGYASAPAITVTVPDPAPGDIPPILQAVPVLASSAAIVAANRLPTIDEVLGPPGQATAIQGGANAYNWKLANGYGPTQIQSIAITASGSGYSASSPPAVSIAAPPTAGGRPATAVAKVVDGVVTAIVLTQIGYGYDAANPPTVTIAPPPGGGRPATATAVVGDVQVMSLQAAATVYAHYSAQPQLLAAMFDDPNYVDVSLPKLHTEFYWPLGWGDFSNANRTNGDLVPQQAIPTFSFESLNRSNAFDSQGNYVPGVPRRTSIDSKYQSDAQLSTMNTLGGTFAGLSSLSYSDFVTFANGAATIIAEQATAGGHPMAPGDVTLQLYDVAFLPIEWVGIQNPNRWGAASAAPVFHGPATGTVAENTPASSIVYVASTSSVSATLADAIVSYAVDAGFGDAGMVTIDPHTGAVRLTTSPNFEAKQSYSFRVVATTGGATPLASTRDVTVRVTDVFESPTAPTIDVPARFKGTEDTALRLVFPTAPFADADSSIRKTMSVTLHVDAGRIDARSFRGVTVGGTPRDRTFTGSLEALDAYFTSPVGRIVYSPPRDVAGPQVLRIGVSEGYRGFRLQSRAEFLVDLAAVDDAPTVRVPSMFTIDEDSAGRLVWPAGAPSVADIDSPVVTVVLTVPDGTLAATGTTAVAVAGHATALSLVGAPADLDRFLKTPGAVTYTPPHDATNTQRLTVTVSDAARTATAVSVIRVRPVNDAPIVAAAGFILGGRRGEALVIRPAALVTAANASDVDSPRVSFIVESVTAGRLARWNGRSWVAISPGTPLAGRVVDVGTPLRWTPPEGAAGVVGAFVVRGWDRAAVSAQSCRISVSVADPVDTSFAYFLDDTAQSSRTPAPYGVAGEFSPVTRQTLAASGVVVGQSVALQNQQPTTGFNIWPAIAGLFTSATPVSPGDTQALARNIINAALLYPGEFPTASEATTTAKGGFVFWAQDFEFTPGKAPTDEVYAGVTAVLWAGRQLLGQQMKILPVMASSLFKTLGDTIQGPYSSVDIAKGKGATPYLASLGLTLLPVNPSATDGEWNFLSFLQVNGLIDGFFGQQYNTKTPGIVTSDTKPFHDADLPYALVSAHDNPNQVTSGQWTTVYNGDILFHAMVYWSSQVDPLWNQSSPRVLTPTRAPLPTAAFAGYGRGG